MSEEKREERIIPRPPTPRSTADFIVLTFVIMVAVILVASTFTALALALFTDKNITPFIAMITDLMTTIISALVGFLAGRGIVNGNGKEHP